MDESYHIDPYFVLGVDHGANQDDIKKAYRDLARQHHPDKNPGDSRAEARFQEIQQAYELIGRKEKRREYDLLNHSPFGAGGPAADMSSVFHSPAQSRSRPPMRGRDLEAEASISFNEALNGTTTGVDVNIEHLCLNCHGDHSRSFVCQRCGGSGLEGEDNGIGMCVCPLCRGEGKVSCNSCGGTGRKIERRHHNVKIPAGVETGTRIRIADKGAQGTSGGPPGDLYVNVSVGENPLYERQGANLILDVPLTYAEAVLGADIVLPTLDGPISLKVPAFSESGRLLRVRGRGTPKLGERTRGDLFARLRITTPESITDDERDLLETLSDISSENPRAHFFTEPPQLDHSGIDQSNGDKGDDVVL